MSQLIYVTSKLRLFNTFFAIQKNATTHPINHFYILKKSVLNKETTHLKEAGRRKAKSDS